MGSSVCLHIGLSIIVWACLSNCPTGVRSAGFGLVAGLLSTCSSAVCLSPHCQLSAVCLLRFVRSIPLSGFWVGLGFAPCLSVWVCLPVQLGCCWVVCSSVALLSGYNWPAFTVCPGWVKSAQLSNWVHCLGCLLSLGLSVVWVAWLGLPGPVIVWVFRLAGSGLSAFNVRGWAVIVSLAACPLSVWAGFNNRCPSTARQFSVTRLGLGLGWAGLGWARPGSQYWVNQRPSVVCLGCPPTLSGLGLASSVCCPVWAVRFSH